jgi:hypothetical protein
MKRLTIIALSLSFGLSRGIHEGMVMVMPFDSMFTGSYFGVRGHAWFAYYHALSLVPYALFAFIVYMTIKKDIRLCGIVGALLLIWQFTEVGNAMARQGNIFYIYQGEAYESINFCDILKITLTGWQVYALAATRCAIGALFIFKKKG